MLIQELTLTINDIDLFCRTVGEGTPLVMLHGFFASNASWEPYFSDLAKDFQLIVPDLRGHGRSTNPSGEFSHRQAALDIYSLLDKLAITKFRAIGFSSGAMTLLHMATQQPQRIEALSLWSGTSYFGKEARAIQQKPSFFTDLEKENPELMQQLRTIHVRKDAQIEELSRQFRKMADTYDDMNFTPAYLSTICAPTLIVHGDRDEFFPIKIAVDMYQAIPKASLWILPNTTHNVWDTLNRLSAADGASTSQQRFPPLVREFLKGS